MSVVSVKERLHRRRSRQTKSGSQVVTTHDRVFLVRVNSVDDGTAVALTANDGSTSIPSYGAGHPTDTDAKAIDKDAEPVGDSSVLFDVTVRYSDQQDAAGGTENPLDRPDRYDWGAREKDARYDEDVDGTKVRNTNGRLFEESPTRDDSVIEVVVTQNVTSFNLSQANSLRHSLNNATVTIDGIGIATGVCKLGVITARKLTEGGVTYYERRLPIQIKASGWNDQFEAWDYYQSPASGSDPPGPVPIHDAAGNLVAGPVALDVDGRRASDGEPAVLTFKPYEQKDWSGLGLS